jgi:hypothetical protein
VASKRQRRSQSPLSDAQINSTLSVRCPAQRQKTAFFNNFIILDRKSARLRRSRDNDRPREFGNLSARQSGRDREIADPFQQWRDLGAIAGGGRA